jgi:ABC-type transport system involved in multi-copper enzyme maturation permease subunit
MMELGLRFVSLPYALALATFVDEIAVADPSARFAWMVAAPVNLVLALGVCLWSAAALRRVMLAEAAGWVPGRGSMLPWLGRGKKSRAVGAAAPEVAAKPSPRRVSTEVLGNPVAWRERRTPLLGSRRVTVAVMVPVGLALAYLYWVGEGRDPALHGFIVLACLSLQMIAAAMLTTSAVASERDGRTLDVLLTTPMTGRAVVLGKLAGCGVRLAVLPVFATLHLLVFILTGDIRWPALVIIPAVIIGHAMLLAGTGLYFGVRCRRGVMASVLNVVLALMLWVAAPLVFGAVRFAVETRRYHPDDTVGPGYLDYIDDVTSALLAAHPFFATVITLEQTEHEGMRRDRWGESFTAWQFGSCAVGSAALAAGIGGFAALRAGKRLERLRGNWR